MKTPTPEPDFPAAHSMDSGWFAIDETGVLAYFDTDEPGAIPKAAFHRTGERAGDVAEGERLWAQVLAPRLARDGLDPGDFEEAWFWMALFESEEMAETAMWSLGQLKDRAGAEICEYNRHFVEFCQHATVTPDLAGSLGFIGFAPSVWELGGRPTKGFPLEVYRCDSYGFAGQYVRRSPGNVLPAPGLPDEMLKLPLEFSRKSTIQLADHFTDDECETWGNVGLRRDET